MLIGQIDVGFAFQRSPQLYHGSRDVVEGHVTLSFTHPRDVSKSVSELHGPLRLAIDLEGTLQTHIDRTKPILTQKKTLCRQHYVIYNGTLDISLGETKRFPFTASFPEYTDEMPDIAQPESSSARRRAGRFPLPPTFSRGSQEAWKKASGVAILYELKAQVIMGGIDVAVQYPTSWPVLTYELALPDPDALNHSKQVENSFDVLNKNLFPQAAEPPRGLLRGVHRALFVDDPKTDIYIRCAGIPGHIFVGQRIAFDVQMRMSDQHPEGIPSPEVWLDSCVVTVRGLTRTSRADRVVAKIGYVEEYREISEDLAVLEAIIQPDGPFSREEQNSKVVMTEPLGVMSSSWALGKISHRHRILIRMRIRAGIQELGFNAECDVVMHATPLDGYHGDDVEAEELPGYAE